MSETRTYQGHTYTRNGPGEQWVLAGPAPRSGVVITDPYKAKDEARKDTSADMEVRRADIQAQNLAREVDRTRLQNPQDLRQEYEKLPEVQMYRLALQQAERAKDTDANPQGDLALTYAFAKAMDPSTAVREGEQASVANSQPIFQAIVEKVKKQFGMDGAGSYTPQARTQLRQQIFRQVSSLKPLYDRARADMTDNARAVGVEPKEVIGRDDTATYAPLFRTYAEKNGDPNGVIGSLIGGDPISAPTGGGGGPAPNIMRGIPDTSGDPQIFRGVDPRTLGGAAEGYADPGMEGIATLYKTVQNPQKAAAYKSLIQFLNGNPSEGEVRNFFANNPILPPSAANDLVEFHQKQGRWAAAPGHLEDRVPLTDGEKRYNRIFGGPEATGIISAANATGLGIPQLAASIIAPDAAHKFNIMRSENWKSALTGDIVGSAVGAGATGRVLTKVGENLVERGAPESVASLLAKPLVGDMVYGGATGANDAASRGENPIVGGVTGTLTAGAGNKVGTAVGKAFPGAVGMGNDIRALDASVPTSDALKTEAGSLYSAAEAKGLTATPDDTLALADSTKAILSKEGRITPKDNLTEVQAKTKEAYNLINDYAGEPMAPTAVDKVRRVIADGGASKDADERRISRLLLDNFDNWSDGTNPDLASGLRDARGVASRYLQGDKIASMRDLAEPGAGQYTQSGMGNALRTQYRGLDRAITRGSESFAPNVEDAVRNVARGDPFRNALRYVGKLAPTGQNGMLATLGLSTAGGYYGGIPGAGGPVVLALLGTGARKAEAGLADRAATVAENAAYGGPDYMTALTRTLSDAGQRGGNIGTGAAVGATESPLWQQTSPVNDLIARLLLGQQEQPVPIN